MNASWTFLSSLVAGRTPDRVKVDNRMAFPFLVKR